jgi:hypothetical protein
MATPLSTTRSAATVFTTTPARASLWRARPIHQTTWMMSIPARTIYKTLPSLLRRQHNGITTITGTLNSEADKDYRLEFFANAQCSQSGYGEGQIYLGATGSRPAVTTQPLAWPFPGSASARWLRPPRLIPFQHVRVFAMQASYRAGHGGNHFPQRRCLQHQRRQWRGYDYGHSNRRQRRRRLSAIRDNQRRHGDRE